VFGFFEPLGHIGSWTPDIITWYAMIGYVIFLSLLLAMAMVQPSARLQELFGFLKYHSGSGLLCFFLGLMVLGIAGTWGLITGIVGMTWGFVNIVFGCCSQEVQQRNEPLLGGNASA
jgi:hypothetical protein